MFVGEDDGSVKQGLFLRRELAHDDFKERVERENFVAEFVLAFFVNLREVKRVDFRFSIKGKIDVLAANSLTKGLIFVFRINDDDFSAKHKRAKGFEFN